MLRDDGQGKAIPLIQPLNRAGLELHLVIGGGEPGVLPDAGQIDLFFAVENRRKHMVLNECGAGLREDCVALPCLRLVFGLHRHLGGGIGLVLAPVDGVVLDDGVFGNMVDSSLHRRVHPLNDRCGVHLLGGSGGDS